MKVVVSADTVALLARTAMALEEGTANKKSLPRWLPNGEPVTELKHVAALLCVDELTAAHAIIQSHNPPASLLAKALVRRVRTPQGAVRYGQPINSIIVRDKQSWRNRIMAAALAGGMTLSFMSGEEPTTGYAVAERGNNEEVPDDVFFDKKQGIAALRKWVIAHEDKFTDDPTAHLGIWHDEDHHEVVLDVAYVIDDRDAAVRLGQENNQQAIWDIANMAEIDTGGTGDRQEKGLRRVRTREGAERYGQNIGDVIREDKRPSKIMSALLAGATLVMLGGHGAPLPEHIDHVEHAETAATMEHFHDHKESGVDVLRNYVEMHRDKLDGSPNARLMVLDGDDGVVLDIGYLKGSDNEQQGVSGKAPEADQRHVQAGNGQVARRSVGNDAERSKRRKVKYRIKVSQ